MLPSYVQTNTRTAKKKKDLNITPSKPTNPTKQYINAHLGNNHKPKSSTTFSGTITTRNEQIRNLPPPKAITPVPTKIIGETDCIRVPTLSGKCQR